MFECCYRSMLFISKMEFLCCLEKVIAFSANFSNLLCAALRIFEDLQWMIWHFCLLIVLSKILVQTSNDVYETVAQSTLRSSWISNYPHPMLEEKEKKKKKDTSEISWSFCVQCVEGIYRTKWFYYFPGRYSCCITDLQMLDVRNIC